MDAVKEYYTGVSEDVLLKNPELRDLRNRLLDAPAKFYMRLQEELKNAQDPQMRAELARAHGSLSRVLREQYGHYPQGLESAKKAIEIWEGLVISHPDAGEFISGLADSYAWAGAMGRESWGVDRCRKYIDKGVALAEQLVRRCPHEEDYLWRLATVQTCSGDFANRTGDPATSQAAYERAIWALEQIPVEKYVDQHFLMLGSCYFSLGGMRATCGDRPGGLKAVAKSIQILTELAKRKPNASLCQEHLARGYANQAGILYESGDPQGAVRAMHKAITLTEELVKKYPNAAAVLFLQIENFEDLLKVQNSIHDTGGSIASMAGALEIFAKLVDRARIFTALFSREGPLPQRISMHNIRLTWSVTATSNVPRNMADAPWNCSRGPAQAGSSRRKSSETSFPRTTPSREFNSGTISKPY